MPPSTLVPCDADSRWAERAARHVVDIVWNKCGASDRLPPTGHERTFGIDPSNVSDLALTGRG